MKKECPEPKCPLRNGFPDCNFRVTGNITEVSYHASGNTGMSVRGVHLVREKLPCQYEELETG